MFGVEESASAFCQHRLVFSGPYHEKGPSSLFLPHPAMGQTLSQAVVTTKRGWSQR